MGWSNTGAAILQAQQVVLVDSDGTVDGTLDGENGLIFYGLDSGGSADNPAMILSTAGDLIWGNFDANADQGPRIELTSTGMFLESGNDQGQDIVAIYQDTVLETDSFDRRGIQVSDIVYASDPTSQGSPLASTEVWHTMTILNGGTAGIDPPQARVMPDGTVLLQGQIMGGTQTAFTTLFNLNGFPGGTNFPLPPKDNRLPACAQNGTGTSFGTWFVDITAAGAVRCASVPSGLTSLHLDGVRFSLIAD